LARILDHLRFERLDFRGDLRIKNALPTIASTNITGVSENAVARSLRNPLAIKPVAMRCRVLYNVRSARLSPPAVVRLGFQVIITSPRITMQGARIHSSSFDACAGRGSLRRADEVIE
jgi:hypothetical protein